MANLDQVYIKKRNNIKRARNENISVYYLTSDK